MKRHEKMNRITPIREKLIRSPTLVPNISNNRSAVSGVLIRDTLDTYFKLVNLAVTFCENQGRDKLLELC